MCVRACVCTRLERAPERQWRTLSLCMGLQDDSNDKTHTTHNRHRAALGTEAHQHVSGRESPRFTSASHRVPQRVTAATPISTVQGAALGLAPWRHAHQQRCWGMAVDLFPVTSGRVAVGLHHRLVSVVVNDLQRVGRRREWRRKPTEREGRGLCARPLRRPLHMGARHQRESCSRLQPLAKEVKGRACRRIPGGWTCGCGADTLDHHAVDHGQHLPPCGKRKGRL